MDLIPRCPENQQLQEQYEQLFSEATASPSCNGSYKDICDVVHKYCKNTDRILVAGCEDCTFIEELYDAGYHFVTSLDSSAINICSSRERNKEGRPEITFVERHGMKTDLNSDSFHVVLDRGVLDSLHRNLLCQRTESNLTEYLEETQRLLTVGGRYVCFTSAPADILDRLLDYFSSGWFVRVHHVEMSHGKLTPLPTFLFVLTKTKFAGSQCQSVNIIELCLKGMDHIHRVKSVSEIKTAVQEIQSYFVLTKSQLENISPGQHVNVDLYLAAVSQEEQSEPRYSMTAVDILLPSDKNGAFAIFIVPQGRETEWLFATNEGQKELACNAGFERLVIVTLGRGHTFKDMAAIKKELSAKVMELAPTTLCQDSQVPFLSIGDDLGSRIVLHEGHSSLSGGYVVEDVTGDAGQKFRRLIFLSNKNAIQSEARIIIVPDSSNSRGKKKGKQKKKPASSSSRFNIDHGYLACQHHRVIVTGLAWMEDFLKTGAAKKGLLVGLGGGGLAMFLHQHFRQLSLEVVELDPCISEIASSWFEFKEDNRMKVIIEDGLVYINGKESKAMYDVIMFDVDSKDGSVGMSSPPQSFVDSSFLSQVQSLLHSTGVFILNLVCRNTTLREQVITDLHAVFTELYSIGIEGEVNEIVIALPQSKYQTESEDKKSLEVIKNSVRDSVKELQQCAKTQAQHWDSSLDLCELTEGLHII